MSSHPLIGLPAQPDGTPFPAPGPSGWPTGTHRVDGEPFAALVAQAFGTNPNEALGLTQACCVIQGGRLVWEAYGPDVDADTPLISWSMAKSFTQALAGMLALDGRCDPSAKVEAPEWQRPDDERAAITFTDLLRMRSGLEWNEDYVDAGTSHCLEMLFGEARYDMAHYAASQPLAEPVGSVFNYSSGTTNILARALGECAGGTAALDDLLRRRLLGALGFAPTEVRFDAAGTFVGSSYIWATARDFARFGLLYLRDGIWDGRRLLPPGWADRARTRQAFDVETGWGYGEHWWVKDDDDGTFWANGYEGQNVRVVPKRDLVVVRLGKSPVQHRSALDRWLTDLIECHPVAHPE